MSNATIRFHPQNSLRMAIITWDFRNPDDPDHMLFRQYSEPFHDAYFHPIEKTDTMRFQFDTSFDNGSVAKLHNYYTGAEVASEVPAELAGASGTLEFEFDLSGTAEGYYYIELTLSDDIADDAVLRSEPFHLKAEHCDTSVVEYYNNEPISNGIDYRSGITFQLRFPGRFVKEASGSETEQVTSVIGVKTLISGQRNKAKVLETGNRQWPLVPEWVIEKINQAMLHDYCTINGIRISGEDALEHSYQGRYLWGSPSVPVPLYEGTIMNIHDAGQRILFS